MDKNLVIFYVRKMIKYQTHQFVVQGAKYYEVQHAVDANVKVYDYYRPCKIFQQLFSEYNNSFVYFCSLP